MRKIVLNVIIIAGILFLGFSAIHYTRESKNLQEKVDFYEKVIEDFGIGEFIDYPELYYNEEYVEQVMPHKCICEFDVEAK